MRKNLKLIFRLRWAGWMRAAGVLWLNLKELREAWVRSPCGAADLPRLRAARRSIRRPDRGRTLEGNPTQGIDK